MADWRAPLMFYGNCRAPQGHIRAVAETVEAVSRELVEETSGLQITGWV